LTSGNGQGRSFVGKDFTGASLVSFNLCNADFHKAKLINTNLTKANITGAKLYGAARDDWKIDGIQCEYVFWDAEGKERTPKDRDSDLVSLRNSTSNCPRLNMSSSMALPPWTRS
jgi:hypothetical protein